MENSVIKMSMTECLHFNICQLSLLINVNELGVGVNESIVFSFVCRMTQMNAQKCYWMLIKMQKSLLNLIYVRMFVFLTLMNVSLRYWSPFHANVCVFSVKISKRCTYAGYIIWLSKTNFDPISVIRVSLTSKKHWEH